MTQSSNGRSVIGGTDGQNDKKHAVAGIEAGDKVGGEDGKEDDAGVVPHRPKVLSIEELAHKVADGLVFNGGA